MESRLDIGVAMGMLGQAGGLGRPGGGKAMATQAPYSVSFDIGRVIQRGLGVIGRQAAPFILLSLLLVGVPSFFIQFLMMDRVAAGDFSFVFAGTWVLSFLVGVLAGYLLQAALVRASIRDLRDEPVEFIPSLVEALKLLLPMIGISILLGLMMIVGLLLLVVPGIIIYLAFIIAVPVLVEERLGVIGSMKRSAELTRGSRWWIFLLLILLLLVSSVIGGTWSIVSAMLGGNAPIVAAAAQMVISTATGLVTATMLASLYLELRLIKEGAGPDGLAAIFS